MIIYNGFRISKKEMTKYIWPLLFDDKTKKIFYKSMFLLFISKGLSIAHPFCLKVTVNALADVSKLDINLACLGLVAFAATRVFSILF